MGTMSQVCSWCQSSPPLWAVPAAALHGVAQKSLSLAPGRSSSVSLSSRWLCVRPAPCGLGFAASSLGFGQWEALCKPKQGQREPQCCSSLSWKRNCCSFFGWLHSQMEIHQECGPRKAKSHSPPHPLTVQHSPPRVAVLRLQ